MHTEIVTDGDAVSACAHACEDRCVLSVVCSVSVRCDAIACCARGALSAVRMLRPAWQSAVRMWHEGHEEYEAERSLQQAPAEHLVWVWGGTRHRERRVGSTLSSSAHSNV